MRTVDGRIGMVERRTRLVSLLAAAALAVSLSGCSATTVLNTLEPRWDVAATRDVAYAPGPRHDVDVYAPKKIGPHTPVVVFIYGGGWDSGEKSKYAFVGSALASHGYLVFIPNYRIYPEAHYPDFLQDCALAVRWAKDHAAQYGGDPGELFLMGHSAGAYNAAMLATDPQWLGAVGMDPHRDLKGMVGLAGPYDFLPLQSDELKAIFGAVGQEPASQPINHVDGREPPMFLAHDLGDTVVYPKNTINMAAKIQAAGGEVETKYYKGLSHALMIGVFAAPLRFLGPVFRDSTQFIDAHASSSASKP
jgi:acetyl esterase/lipase|nr:carboxylesterase [uncultured bacterium]